MRTASAELLWQDTWHVRSSSTALIRPLDLALEAWEFGHGSGKPACWRTPKFDVHDVGKTWVVSAVVVDDYPELDWKAMVSVLLGRRDKPETQISLSALSEWTGRPWHPRAAPGTTVERLELTLDRLEFHRHPATRAWLHDIEATLRIYGHGELVVNVSVPRD